MKNLIGQHNREFKYRSPQVVHVWDLKRPNGTMHFLMRWKVNAFPRVTWKNIDSLKWLDGRLVIKYQWEISTCISQLHKEENAFLHVTWININWLGWLNWKMANTMANGRFPMTWRSKYISSCNVKRKNVNSMMKRYILNYIKQIYYIL